MLFSGCEAFLVYYQKNAVTIVVANKNAKGILAGQNAGFALVYYQKNAVTVVVAN